jgi:hypothetical protein
LIQQRLRLRLRLRHHQQVNSLELSLSGLIPLKQSLRHLAKHLLSVFL